VALELYSCLSEASSSFCLGRMPNDLRFLASGLVTERIVALSSNSSLETKLGITEGSRDGAGLFHTTSTTESNLAAFSRSASLLARAFSAHIGVGMGSSISLIYTSFLFFPLLCTS
jgi:hypothetical protein